MSNTLTEPESIGLKDSKIENARHLILKYGTYVSLEDKELYYMSKHKDSANVLIIKDTEGYKIRDTVKNVTRVYYKERLIPLTDVKEIYFEKKEFDSKSATVAAITAAIGAGLLFLVYSFINFLNGLNDAH